MSSFQKVGLLGKGFLGSAVLEQLVKAQFSTTVLTRSQSALKDVPSGVQVKEVDYTSIDSLKAALQGIDVVVSTVNAAAIPLQKLAIDASIAVGVKRFIPADFGAVTTNPAAHFLPVIGHVVEIQKYLAEKVHAGDIEFTIFSVGGFLENQFMRSVAVDWENHTSTIYDGGHVPISFSTLPTVGRAVAAALRKPAETKNRVVHVHDIVLTQRKILEIAKKIVPGKTWTEAGAVDSEPELQGFLERARTEGMKPEFIFGIFKNMLLGKRYASAYKSVDNELLGLGLKSEEDVVKFGAEIRQRSKL
ncbi:aromatic alcohol reductase [Aspergillus lucknowensis]|uniref:NmrA-like family protein n=1 Tax=Aspergillus lucknowensis TaxID=176173 RepID=A0ABR4LYH4_9EURO